MHVPGPLRRAFAGRDSALAGVSDADLGMRYRAAVTHEAQAAAARHYAGLDGDGGWDRGLSREEEAATAAHRAAKGQLRRLRDEMIQRRLPLDAAPAGAGAANGRAARRGPGVAPGGQGRGPAREQAHAPGTFGADARPFDGARAGARGPSAASRPSPKPAPEEPRSTRQASPGRDAARAAGKLVAALFGDAPSAQRVEIILRQPSAALRAMADHPDLRACLAADPEAAARVGAWCEAAGRGELFALIIRPDHERQDARRRIATLRQIVRDAAAGRRTVFNAAGFAAAADGGARGRDPSPPPRPGGARPDAAPQGAATSPRRARATGPAAAAAAAAGGPPTAAAFFAALRDAPAREAILARLDIARVVDGVTLAAAVARDRRRLLVALHPDELNKRRDQRTPAVQARLVAHATALRNRIEAS